MKNIFYFLVALLLFSSRATAQERNISSILPSSAPAFTILGTTPVDISKPNNWNALQTALYQNLVADNNFVVPKDFALEFYPYWLKDRPTFTYKDYLNSNGFTMRNAAVSIASAKTQYGNDTAQCIGFGFRIPVMTGNRKSIDKIKQDLTSSIDAHRTTVLKWQSDFQFFIVTYAPGNTMTQFFTDIDSNIATPPATPAGLWSNRMARLVSDTLKTVFDANSDLYSTHVGQILNVVAAYISNLNYSDAVAFTEAISKALKDVSRLEISGAMSVAFPTDKFNFSKVARLALWGAYSFDVTGDTKINGTAALRYIRDFEVDTIRAANNIDGILRLNFVFGSRERFTISALGDLRYRSAKMDEMVIGGSSFYRFENDMDTKLVVDLSVKLSETIAFSYSIGKNFGKDLYTIPNSLISFLNIFYSINTKVARTGKDAAGLDTFGFKN